MNDLRLLLQYDKQRKIINLQYKQISTFEPLLPILAKFQNLQSLSLYGNRLKSLPTMQMLTNLVEIDLSNNLFSELKYALKGLKSLPNLKHLIYTFKNDQQEYQIRSQLPNLERINKKPLNTNKVATKKVKKNQLKLQQKDLEQIGLIYDDIRQIYKKSKYMIDKQLMIDFDKNVDIIMTDLSMHLNNSKSSTQIDTSIITCRYGLIDMCFIKVITYFYHFDKSIAMVLQKVHDYIAQSFKSMGQIIKIQQEKMNTQISKVKTKKQQLYKTQIKRLKVKDQINMKQVDYLEKKNNQLLRILADYSKNNFIQKYVVQNFMKNFGDRSARSNIRKQNENQQQCQQNQGRNISSPYQKKKDFSPVKQKNTITKAEQVDFRKSSKNLTLNQLKQIVNDMYVVKVKQDKICIQSGLQMETMENYMYTYLNQKYGLKNITIQWAMGIVNGIKRYGSKQPQIAVFGKVLRNQFQEGFHEHIKKIKQNLSNQIKKFKSYNNLEQDLTFNQAQQVLLNCRYSRDTIMLIIPKLRQQCASLGKLPQQKLQKGLLEYIIRQHQQQIKYFLSIFKKADKDEDGIVNRNQLLQIVDSCGKQVDAEILFEYIDPFNNDKMTYSYIYEAFSKDQSYKEILKKPLNK